MPPGDIDELEFVYVGDPMCSWCWGFAPVLERLDAHYDIPIRVVVGGLRPGPSAERIEGIKDYLAHHWEQVAERSGQPFDHRALDRPGWIYDTEVPCTAVVAMRNLNQAEELRFFTRLQQAFYAENVDVTDPAAYPKLLTGFAVEADRFMEMLTSEEMRRATWEDFDEARRLSATGFPTLLIDRPAGPVVVTRGYLPWEPLRLGLSRWLEAEYGTG